MKTKFITECRKLNNRLTLGLSIVDDLYYDEAYLIINFLYWRIRLGFAWSEGD